MKYLLKELKQVENLLKKNKSIGLFLDFDGTLAPIANSPSKACLSAQTKKILLSLQKKPQLFLAIVSGRKLEDLKNKINIPGLIYAGNHGLEWEIGGKRQSITIRKKTIQTLLRIKKQIKKMEEKFEGVCVEDKGLTLSIHYRQLKEHKIESFKKTLINMIKPYITPGKLKVMKGKKVYDIGPEVSWTKGHVSRLIINQISKMQNSKLTPIYIGDDKTDEDAFFQLKEEIIVRVEKSKESQAEYYVEDTAEVTEFLEWLDNKEVIKPTIKHKNIDLKN